ncbi:hypothetical protein LPN04_31255 [Rugamonas sp. A1-17]|nr:hypothetical protein [Rugamonas sp. A1-17]
MTTTTTPNRNHSLSVISPHVSTGKVLCYCCGSLHPKPLMLETFPVHGMTVWHCTTCQNELAATEQIKQARRVATAKATYLERKGYKPMTGDYWIAKNARLGKGVAFINDDFRRDTFKRIQTDANRLGLTHWTVLVTGLITYMGAGFTAIRVLGDESDSFAFDDIHADLMADVRAGKNTPIAR